jgi:hypothetical protein
LIHYAHKLKIDPEFLKEGDPSHEIRKTRSDLIAFIRTQEKDHLKPLYDQVSLLVDQHSTTSDNLLKKDDYKGMEGRMVNNQKLVINACENAIKKFEETYNNTITKSDTKAKEVSDQLKRLEQKVGDMETYRRKVRNTVEAYFQALQDNWRVTGVKDREKIEEAFKRDIYSL